MTPYNTAILFDLADWSAEEWVNGNFAKSCRIYRAYIRRTLPLGVDWDGVVKRRIKFYRLKGGE